MPKPGFKSITVAETTYERFYQTFDENREALKRKGVNSFSGYINYMMEEMIQKDKTFAKYAPRLEKVAVDDDRIIIKDNKSGRVAEIVIQRGELYCHLCEEKGCVHVGFVFSLPDVYKILDARGIKNPR